MISSIQGSMPNISEMRQQMQKMQDFQSGKTNLSKDDLSKMQNDMKSMGIDAPKGLQDITNNFDKIDTNGDGISSNELNSYTGGKALSSIMGPPPGLMDEQGASGSISSKPNNSSSYIDMLLKAFSSFDKQSETSTTSIDA